jgi:hypothetical protein
LAKISSKKKVLENPSTRLIFYIVKRQLNNNIQNMRGERVSSIRPTGINRTITVKEAIEALNKCHPDAEILFSVDFQSGEGGLIGIEHEVMWLREKGDAESPGRVYLHNNISHIVNEDGSQATGSLFIT